MSSASKTRQIQLYCLALAFMVASTGCQKGESGAKAAAFRPKGPDAVLGRTTLHSAPNWAVAERLIREGADVNARDSFGMTPLHCAAAAGHEEAVRVLLAAGADIGIKDNEGRSPLDLARNLGHTEIAELLAQQGAANNGETETSIREPTDH